MAVGTSPAFGRYIGIDYSGAATPDSRLTGLRVYMAEGDGPAEEVRPNPANTKVNWTRRKLYEWLLKQLKEDAPTLVGIDHAFSFPNQYFEAHKVEKEWDAFLGDFHKHFPADKEGAVVGKLREKAGLGKERGGDTRWRRESEQRTKAKSVFQFNVNGSVAHSTHAGLPWLLFLRRELGDRVVFWPFEGWTPPAGKSLVAEVYPSLWRRRFPIEDVTGDQQDAYAVTKWLQQTDRHGWLAVFLKPMLTDDERRLAEYEGWILGVM